MILLLSYILCGFYYINFYYSFIFRKTKILYHKSTYVKENYKFKEYLTYRLYINGIFWIIMIMRKK